MHPGKLVIVSCVPLVHVHGTGRRHARVGLGVLVLVLVLEVDVGRGGLVISPVTVPSAVKVRVLQILLTSNEGIPDSSAEVAVAASASSASVRLRVWWVREGIVCRTLSHANTI